MTRLPIAAGLGALLLSALSVQPAASQDTPVDTAAAVQAAEAAATEWLALVDGGQIADSWDQAATVFKDAIAQPAWEQSVQQARGPFEPFGSREQIVARYQVDPQGAPPGRYVTLQYRTAVAGDRHVVETVVPMWDGDRGWRVSGYYVRPE